MKGEIPKCPVNFVTNFTQTTLNLYTKFLHVLRALRKNEALSIRIQFMESNVMLFISPEVI